MNAYPPNPELIQKLEAWLREPEGERLEFKEAKGGFSSDELARYCCAMANGGGGKIILGVTDRRPRRIVGTSAFPRLEETRRSLMQQIPVRIDAWEIRHPDGRVLVFEVASRPLGTPLKYKGRYWSRQADSLVPMTEDRLRAIFAETGRDFTAEVCPKADLSHLDPTAIEDFRNRWIRKSGNHRLGSLSHEQLLRDAELLTDEGLTYAALILFGTREALGRFLPQAEVIFEYRPSGSPGPAADRKEWRRGFFSFYDELWDIINRRNDLQHYREGLFVQDIPTFDEQVVREAILNAVSHRDYQLGGSVFVRQYPRKLVVESPGGFPPGITLENILDRQAPRNRRIAETFARCGLVERSGQGMDLIFERTIRHAKPLPDFTGTDEYGVTLTLHGQVQDPAFVRFLEKVSRETQASFDVHDLLLLALIHREEEVPEALRPRARRLADLGVIETIGRGRGTRYLLSRRFFVAYGREPEYTRRKGLGREHNKALLLQHLKSVYPRGCPMAELQEVTPAISRAMVKRLLDELRSEGFVRLESRRRWSRWFATGKGMEQRGGYEP